MTGFSALPGGSSSLSGASWAGVTRIKGPKWARMPLLTLGMLGLQIVWSVEMGYASPYLLSLGLSKSLMSIVFVAGPLSGLIVQPLIGVFADHSKSRFGRRRPYMLGGSLVCVGAIILLGFTRWFSTIFVSAGTRANDLVTIAFAVWSIYCIDFSINAVQAADRALLVDVLPPAEQEVGNAWAGRMFGLGSVAGFFVGNINLPKALPFLGKTQLQVLSVVTSVFLMLTHGVTSASVTERVLVKDAPGEARGSLVKIVKDIWQNIMTLPTVILHICIIQFFSWIAWFPVLFFSTVWIGEIYTRQMMAADSSLENNATLQADATRAGSGALLWSSVLSLGASIILPFLVHQSSFSDDVGDKEWVNSDLAGRGKKNESWAKVGLWLKSMRLHLATLWMVSHVIFAVTMGLTYFTTTVENASALITITGFSWAVSQWVPFSLLGEAILVTVPPPKYDPNDETPIPLLDHRTHRASNSLVGPGAAERQGLMFNADVDDGEDTRDAIPLRATRPELQTLSSSRSSLGSEAHKRVRSPFGLSKLASTSNVNLNLIPQSVSSYKADDDSQVTAEGGRLTHDDGMDSDEETLRDLEATDGPAESNSCGGGISNKAGIILGIHNIFVVIPQFLVTALSSILFAILEPDKSIIDQGHAGHPHAGNVPVSNSTHVEAAASVTFVFARQADTEATASRDSIGIIFRIGGLSAAVAAVLCWRLSRKLLGKER